MPSRFEGEPTKEQIGDKRLLINDKDEPYLLDLADKNGIKESDIGAFAVIIVAGVPIQTEIEPEKFEWALFTEDELKEEASKAPERLFYDEKNQRIVAIAPPLPPRPKS